MDAASVSMMDLKPKSLNIIQILCEFINHIDLFFLSKIYLCEGPWNVKFHTKKNKYFIKWGIAFHWVDCRNWLFDGRIKTSWGVGIVRYTTTTLIYNVLHLPTVGVNYSKNGFKESGWSTKTHQFLLKISICFVYIII